MPAAPKRCVAVSDALAFDADGYVDMDRFPDDGTDVDAAVHDDLRARLLADPVDEPGPEAWEDMCADAVAGADPFDVDDPPFADGSEALFDDGVAVADPAAETFDHDPDPGAADDLDLDDLDPDDGVDPFDVGGHDDAFDTDAVAAGDDLPAVDDPLDDADGDAAAIDGVDGVDGHDLGHGLDGLL